MSNSEANLFQHFCSWPASLNRSLKTGWRWWSTATVGRCWSPSLAGLSLKTFLGVALWHSGIVVCIPFHPEWVTRWGKIESCSDTSLQSRNQQCLWDTCLRPAWAWTGLSCYIHNISLTVWSAEQRWVRFSSIQAHGLASMKMVWMVEATDYKWYRW
jgi:hypothetical protein